MLWQHLGLSASPAVQGLVLTCPPAPITLVAPPPTGRLAGLQCYAAASAASVLVGATPQRNVQDLVVVPQDMSAASVFGIILGVLAVVAAVGGAGYFLWRRQVCF